MVGAPRGRPENRWRYRLVGGRWWYWTPGERWSYFDGSRWVAYRGASDFDAKKVDPALLRLEAKEGTLGSRTWAQAGGGSSGAANSGGGSGAAWTMSGTRGSFGGGSSFATPATPPRGR